MDRAVTTERAWVVATHSPGGVAMVDGDRVYVAIEPVETVSCDDPRKALGVFAETIRAWGDRAAGTCPQAFGWLAYDAMRSDEPGGFDDARPPGDCAPYAVWVRYAAVLVIENGVTRVEGADRAACERLDAAWERSASSALPEIAAIETWSRTDRARHVAHVDALRESIRNGEVYLVNLARVVHAKRIDALQLAARIHRSRAPLAMYLDAGECSLAGMSMELGLSWDRASGTLETRPIKGTRPRGHDATEDAAMIAALASDPKERAENVMAVDVHRNDLGRVARAGTVTVPSLCAVETHAYVHHLVSTVRAVVRDDAGVEEVLEAVLPLGSVTGAPKRAAMMQIAAREIERRGVYTGVYGSLAHDGSLRLAVAIRTAITDANGTHYGVGGGVVADSDAAREWDELSWKERAFAGR